MQISFPSNQSLSMLYMSDEDDIVLDNSHKSHLRGIESTWVHVALETDLSSSSLPENTHKRKVVNMTVKQQGTKTEYTVDR